MKLKVCKRCGDEKPIDEFVKAKQCPDGYRNTCKTCHNIATKAIVRDYTNVPNTYKICKKCGEEKTLVLFPKSKKNTDGYRNTCNSCVYTHRNLHLRNKRALARPKVIPPTIGHKFCAKCNNEKLLEEFVKAKNCVGGYRALCKTCYNIEQNTYTASRRTETKVYHKRNREKKTKEQKKHDRILWRERHNIRMLTEPLYKITTIIRSSIRGALRRTNHRKTNKTESILGCTFLEFKQHLESNFEPWMSWENYGKCNGKPNYGWDIDHIIPISTAMNIEDVLKLNHHTNLQPLCSKVNRYVKKNIPEFTC